MKRKFLTALVIAGGLFLTACQEDETMDELIQDVQSESLSPNENGGSGGSGSAGGGDGVG